MSDPREEIADYLRARGVRLHDDVIDGIAALLGGVQPMTDPRNESCSPGTDRTEPNMTAPREEPQTLREEIARALLAAGPLPLVWDESWEELPKGARREFRDVADALLPLFLRERERAEAAEARARRAEETRENANRVSVRVELENKSLRARAERAEAALEEAREVLALIYVMLTGAEPMWAEMPWDERCARAANEAQAAFTALDRLPVALPDPAEKRGLIARVIAGIPRCCCSDDWRQSPYNGCPIHGSGEWPAKHHLAKADEVIAVLAAAVPVPPERTDDATRS